MGVSRSSTLGMRFFIPDLFSIFVIWKKKLKEENKLRIKTHAHCNSNSWNSDLACLYRVHKCLCYLKLFPYVLTLTTQTLLMYRNISDQSETINPHFKSKSLVLRHSRKKYICELSLLSVLSFRTLSKLTVWIGWMTSVNIWACGGNKIKKRKCLY